MKKLSLDLTKLKVDSFVTSDDRKETKGTILGNRTRVTDCMGESCPADECGPTMNWTCFESCPQTCGYHTCDYTCDDVSCNQTNYWKVNTCSPGDECI